MVGNDCHRDPSNTLFIKYNVLRFHDFDGFNILKSEYTN